MRIDLTEIPTNPADQTAAYFVVDWINVDDGTIRGNLYDAEDTLVAHRRVYGYTGENIPFDGLTTAQIDYMTGGHPDETWTAYLIGLWLDRRGIEYPGEATVAQLLALVPAPDEGL